MDVKRPRKAVIPCAGYGTRFLPITKIIPKELLPIGNKPAIHYVVEEAVAAGIEEVVLVCNRSKVSIADYFKPDQALIGFLEKRGKGEAIEELKKLESMAEIRVVYQEEAKGLGDAVLCSRTVVGGEPFLVILPDDLIVNKVSGSEQLLTACGERNGWGILLERVPKERVSSYGIIRGAALGEKLYTIEGALEKPRPEEAPTDLSIIGRYCFPAEIFEWIEKSKVGRLGEIQLTDAIDRLAKQQPGIGVLCQGRRFDIGTPKGLLEAGQEIRP